MGAVVQFSDEDLSHSRKKLTWRGEEDTTPASVNVFPKERVVRPGEEPSVVLVPAESDAREYPRGKQKRPRKKVERKAGTAEPAPAPQFLPEQFNQQAAARPEMRQVRIEDVVRQGIPHLEVAKEDMEGILAAVKKRSDNMSDLIPRLAENLRIIGTFIGAVKNLNR